MKLPAAPHPEDIKASVRKKAGSLAALARQHGKPTSTVRKSLTKPLPAGNRVIAECLGLQLHELWPDWYDATGNRIRPSGKDRSSGPRPGHRQKRRRK